MTPTYERAATEAGCFRCGYPLIGIADDQPCPECGLLAVRSRRKGDELYLARPRWLRRMKLGVTMLIAAALWPWILGLFLVPLGDQLSFSMFDVLGSAASPLLVILRMILPWSFQLGSAILLIVGAKLLATPEGHEPADQADRQRRRWLIIGSMVPLLALIEGVSDLTDYRDHYGPPGFFARSDIPARSQ